MVVPYLKRWERLADTVRGGAMTSASEPPV